MAGDRVLRSLKFTVRLLLLLGVACAGFPLEIRVSHPKASVTL